MSLSRILATVAAIAGIAVIAVVLYLLFADLGKYRPTVEQAVTEATGRQFKISGAFELDVLPSPSIVMEDVTLANAPWGSDPLLLKVGHLSAKVGLWSVLFGPLKVREFRLHDTSVMLETDAEGTPNWEMRPAAAEPEAESRSGDAELPVVIDFAEIRNVTLTIRQADSEARVVDIAELTIQPNPADNLGLAGNGSVLGLAFALSGEIGPREALQALDAVTYNVAGNLGSLTYRIDGQTAEPRSFVGTSLQAVVETDAIEETLAAFNTESPLEGPLKIQADLVKDADKTSLKVNASAADVSATADTTAIEDTVTFEAGIATLDKVGDLLELAGLPAEELKLSGALAIEPEAIQVTELLATVGSAGARASGSLARGDGESTVDIKASGPSLAQLRLDLPEIPFTLDTRVRIAAETTELSPFALTFGASDVTGDIRLGSATPAKTEIRLNSNLLDMTPFYQKNVADEEARTKNEAAAKTADEPKSQYVFSDEPFALDALRKNEADVDLSIARLVRDTLELETIRTTIALHEGKLDIRHAMYTPGGGASESTIAVTTAGDQANLDLLSTFSAMKLNLSSGKTTDIALVPSTDVTLDIEATGKTPHAMAASTHGRLLLTQGPGRVENDLVGRFSGDIFSQLFGALNPLSKEEEYSNWECSVFAIDFTDGLGEISGFLLQGEKLMIVGGGDIDLNTEKLNIEFNTKPRKGVGVSADMFITPFIKLGGTLASPKIGLSKKGVLLSGGAAVLTGGLSFLFQGAADRATAAGGLCEKTLAEVGPHGALDQSTGIKPQPE
ncbi:MAG: AsmA family protein [Chromatiales bacterium]|nr:AsmA family protein [Chromatiales bacterium]